MQLNTERSLGTNVYSPQAVPGVDLAVIQVVLFSSVEHKLSLVGAIFLKQKKCEEARQFREKLQ